MTRDQYLVWVSEIGPRAALHARTVPGDLRWFRGLCR